MHTMPPAQPPTPVRRLARAALWATGVAIAAIAVAAPAVTPAPVTPVTDATVVARVGSILRKQDHEALAAYYRAKAEATVPLIEAQERLLRAYMALDAKAYSAEQRDARALLKAARMTKKHYEQIAVVHQRVAWESND